MSLIEATSARLGCKPIELFQKAAVDLGWIGYIERANKWMGEYLNEQTITSEVVDWCLSKLYPLGEKGDDA